VSYNYIVSYSTGSNGPWTQAGTSSTASFTINNLSNGNYYVQVIAVDTVTGLQSTPTVGGPFTVGNVTTQQESPDQTSVTSSSQTIFSSKTPGQPAPTGGPFDTWSITGQGGQVVRNGVADPTTSALLQLYYLGHVVYQQASNGNSFGTPGWWSWTGTTWADAQSPIGQVLSITGISLSNSIITAGAPAGTVVGTLAVSMSFGSFSGTLALGGANASSFSLSGSNTVVTTPASFPTGNFSLAATATQASASNSPFTTPQPFSIVSQSSSAGPGPPASSPFITADFTNAYPYPGGGPSGGLTGQQMVISPRLWGVSTGAAADNSFARLASFKSQFAIVNPGIWRVNGNENDRGDTNYWNNDLSVNTATFAKMINNHPTVDPLGISGWVIGANINQFAGSPPGTGGTALSNYGTAMGNLASYLLNATMPNGKKFPIIGFESHNEDDGNPNYNVTPSIRIAYFNAMASAVKSVSSSLLTFGPTCSFFGSQMPTFQNGATNFDVYDAHMYNQGNDPGVPAVYQQGAPSAAGTGLTSWPANGKVCFLGEYNISYACSGANLRNWASSMFVANTLMQYADAMPVQAWAGIWDAIGDSDCGIIAAEDQPNSGTIYPNGYLLGKAVRTVTGQRWGVPTNSTGMRTMAVTPAAGRFGLMILNNGQGTKSGSVALSHWPVNSSGNGTINMWRQTSATTADGVSTPNISVTSGITQSISFPDPSVTILWV
jgi:hypothetical protein